MDKKFVIALALCLIILIGYPYYMKMISPPKQPVEEPEAVETVSREAKLIPSSAKKEQIVIPKTQPTPAVTPDYYSISNERMDVTFSNVWASIVRLDSMQEENGEIVGNKVINVPADEPGSFALYLLKKPDSQPIVYQMVRKTDSAIEFVSKDENGVVVRKTYTLVPDRDELRLEVSVTNTGTSTISADYDLVSRFFIGEKRYGRAIVNAAYYDGEKVHKKGTRSMKKKPFLNKQPLRWVGSEEKYFVLLIAPEKTIESASTTCEASKELISSFSTGALSLAPGETSRDEYIIFAGPKIYDELKSYNLGFEKLTHSRFLGNLWVYLFIVLQFFYAIFRNYGVAIIALSVLIKIIFWPLTHMSFKSMKRMQDLQPKIKAVQEQYKKDPQRMNKEVMQLYKTNKVNPLGGCFPMLLQMPIFIALYQCLTQAVQLHGAPFIFWINDLSKPDHLFTMPFSLPFLGSSFNVLPLLMIVSMVWQQKLTPSATTSKDQKTMMLMMPVIFGLIFYNLPSGLVLYWFVNNVLTIGHQLLFHKSSK